jgi:hypothetical protein
MAGQLMTRGYWWDKRVKRKAERKLSESETIECAAEIMCPPSVLASANQIRPFTGCSAQSGNSERRKRCGKINHIK